MFDLHWLPTGGLMWLLRLFLLVALTASVDYLLQRLLRYARSLLRATRPWWDEMLLEAARLPLRLLVWVLGLSGALSMLTMKLDNWPELLSDGRRVGVIMTVAWLAFRAAGGWQEWRIRQMQTGHSDPTAILAIGRLLRASILITAALVILETLGFSISGVLAFGGIGGVAVGFAAKDMLANFFGGLMIFLDRPFTVGDWIRSPDRQIEGIVEQIGWRITVVRDFEKQPVYIPNSTFSSIAVVTPSRMTHRRLREMVGLRYRDLRALPAVMQSWRQRLQNDEQTASALGVVVHLDRFAESSLDVLIQCYTEITAWGDFMAWREQILLDLAALAAEHEAEFAFPTRQLLVEQWPELALAGRPGSAS